MIYAFVSAKILAIFRVTSYHPKNIGPEGKNEVAITLQCQRANLTLGFNCLGLRKDDSEVPPFPNSALSSIVCGKAAMSAEMWKGIS